MELSAFTVEHIFQVYFPLIFGAICAILSSRKNLNPNIWSVSGAMFGPISLLLLSFKKSKKDLPTSIRSSKSFVQLAFKVDLVFLVAYDAFLTSLSLYVIYLAIQNPSLGILESYGYRRLIIDFIVLLTLILGLILLFKKFKADYLYFFLVLGLYTANHYSGVIQILEVGDNVPTDSESSVQNILIIFLAIRTVIWPLYALVTVIKESPESRRLNKN